MLMFPCPLPLALATKMPLPSLIRTEFENIYPRTTEENDYNGVYNLLLLHAFPATEGYVIHPYVILTFLLSNFSMKLKTASQVAPPTAESHHSRDVLCFTLYFRVYFHRIPVFFLGSQTALAIESASYRTIVDDQMRLRMRELFDQSISEVHGISALGTKLCFYCLDKKAESLTPRFIPRDTAYIKDVAPAHLWGSDLLTDDGYDRFMGIVQRVKARAADEGV